VEYKPERTATRLDPAKELYGLREDFIQKLIYTKAREWSYEREWRVIAELTHADERTGFHYVNFGPQLELREVILGCRNSTPVGQIAKLVRNNSAQVRVSKLRPGFQRFEMVENKRIKAINVPAR
jgi:hypothetical protein